MNAMDPSIEEEAQSDKLEAQKKAPQLLAKWQEGPQLGSAYVWYWGHFWGRAEIWNMTLHFAGVPHEFCWFSNDEYDALKVLLDEHALRDYVNGPLPVMQIDGHQISDSLVACRYVGQTRSLYPDPSDIANVLKIESLLTGAQGLFQCLIDHHYKGYNKQGGSKVASTDDDRSKHAQIVARKIQQFFSFVESSYLERGELNLSPCPEENVYLIGGRLTIADLFVCHYRSVVGQPEFWPLCRDFFEGNESVKFGVYFSKMLAGAVGEYFRTRHGAKEHPQSETISALVEKEVRLQHAAVVFPFEW